MPRSCWEPWGLFRKPFAGTIAENLRTWGTGGLHRKSTEEPFKDAILCSPTRGAERKIAPHPSLKPQRFLRQIVRAALPLGIGIICDPFAGSGATLAAAEAIGFYSVGTDRDPQYFGMARRAFPDLTAFPVRSRDANGLFQVSRLHGQDLLDRLVADFRKCALGKSSIAIGDRFKYGNGTRNHHLRAA
jgi:site-specific DNA-methyltransferase (adenine-specific)